MISCTRFDELHQASLDAPLPEVERREFDAHLTACPSCVERLKGYVTATEVLAGLDRAEDARTPAPLAESFVKRVVASMRAAAREGKDRSRRTG